MCGFGVLIQVMSPFSQTKVFTSDNHSHKEKKTDPSAMKKQSKNEGGKKTEHSSSDQLAAGVDKLSIEVPTSTSDRDKIKVKILINVPVGVTPEMSERPESHCQTFLDLLRRTAFKPEDEFRYNDIAVVFGINGKESEKGAIETEFQKPIQSKIAFKKFNFTWEKNIPFRKIRETIKEHEHTREFVKQFRTESPECKIYFCFFDADAVDFNHVLSSYIDVIHEHKYPTVMSTGYVFPKDSENRVNSERDRQVRIKTAEHFPLGTYYPEANFCVLLPDEEDTLPEKFDYPRDFNQDMESPILITQVKTREGFKAVFADKNPVVTSPPKQCKFHTNSRTWAMSASAHRDLEFTDEYISKTQKKGANDRRAGIGAFIPLLMDLINNAKITEEENRKHFKSPGADQVFQGAGAVRHLLE
ncbi:uncharacterized protein LOC130418007 isoform X2 [Triplophysa dalaica]|uniref:uncharacterized protein LOC130418007 isoform X2 n=1 Tax=Triplophysa dalaica TaxID=1582913 RepID=UPI0024E004CC|nr:uncharacterized protein LOC130418007 isoform X2 [Triplophysa dalaica]